jgi:hypothetical protein
MFVTSNFLLFKQQRQAGIAGDNFTPEQIKKDVICNARIIAEPAIAQYCATQLSDFNNSIFQVKICWRSLHAEMLPVDILPGDDLFLKPIDLVVGGRSELEKRARVFLWNKLLQERNHWRIAIAAFGDDDLVRTLLQQKILIVLTENNQLVCFDSNITDTGVLRKRLAGGYPSH